MMEHSEIITDLVASLVKFQAAITSVKKTETNPYYNSRYADLDAVWDMIRKPLTDNGLAVVQTTEIGDERLALITTLVHTSGQWWEFRYPLVPMKQRAKEEGGGWWPAEDPQSIGSAITYARRYSLSAMLGISSEEDDDGEKAMRRDAAPTTAANVRSAQRSAASPPADTLWCTEHQTNWFKRGAMKSFAHPIGDTKKWCNMPKQDVPSEAPGPTQDTPDAAERPSVEASGPVDSGDTPQNVGDLLTRAVNELGYLNRAEIFEALGVRSAVELANPGMLSEAWAKLKAAQA